MGNANELMRLLNCTKKLSLTSPYFMITVLKHHKEMAKHSDVCHKSVTH